MMTCLHKYYSPAALIDFFKGEIHPSCTFFTMGIKDDDFEKFRSVKAKADVRLVCVDAANGYTKFFVERVKRIREEFSKADHHGGQRRHAGNGPGTPDLRCRRHCENRHRFG